MVDNDGPVPTRKQTDAEREKALDDLRAMRGRRIDTANQADSAVKPYQQTKGQTTYLPQRKQESVSLDLSAPRKEDADAAIATVRASRMQAEAYHDVTILREKAHAHQHKAAKFQTKSKTFEARAQKAITKAVIYRDKARKSREKGKDFEARGKDLETELKASAAGEVGIGPEKIRLKISKLDRKAASLNETGRRFDAKAALQNERAANFRLKAAFNLEQTRKHEAEMMNFAKRADNLEKAGMMD